MTATILIVDDDPVQRRLLEAMVRRFGYDAQVLDGGAAALARLEAPDLPRVDLLICDLVMPDVDGMTVLARMRDRKITVPAIVQTAHGTIDTVISAMRAGATDFVVKPVGAERLSVSIKNALRFEAPGRRSPPDAAARVGCPHVPRYRDQERRHESGHSARGTCRALDDPGADRGRVGGRQGADGARHPGWVRPGRANPSCR